MAVRSGEENNGSRNDRARHRSNVTSTFCFLNGSQCHLFPVNKTHIVNVHIELAAARHSPFGLSVCHRT
jgi:hypothetical protein